MARGITRRAWLRGVGGAALAIPVLPSLLPRSARAEGDAPLRLFFVGCTFGRSIANWYPLEDPVEEVEPGVFRSSLREASNEDGHISNIFGAAWDDLRDDFTLVRGLDGMHFGDAHGTAMPLTASGSKGTGPGFGYSMDVVLAESSKMYAEPPFLDALRACPVEKRGRPSWSYTSRSGVVQRINYDPNPYETYLKLFHPKTLADREAYAQAHQPVLNAVMEDYRDLMSSSRMSADDRYKLESHLALISDVERQLGVSVASCPDGVDPGAAFSRSEDMHTAAFKLEVAALACGLTKMVCHGIVHFTSEIKVNGGEAHSAAHGGKSRPQESGRDSVWQWELDRWQMERIAGLIRLLKDTPDANGTSLFDNTILFHTNNEARGYHNFFDLPVLLSGAPHKLRLGEYVDYRARPLESVSPQKVYPGRPYNNMLVTLMQAFGLGPSDYERFGRTGFGRYDGYDLDLADHYRPFLAAPNVALPHLLRG